MHDDFDEEFASDMLGKHVLVGITFVDAAERPVEQRHLHGWVVRASRNEGVVLKLEPSGEELKLPPLTRAFDFADPGEYRLDSTGEVIIDPDYTCAWFIRDPVLH